MKEIPRPSPTDLTWADAVGKGVTVNSLGGHNRVQNTAQLPLDDGGDTREILEVGRFLRRVGIERKRTERSREAFILMVAEGDGEVHPGRPIKEWGQIVTTLLSCTRETDVVGWYKEHQALGVMFTGIDMEERNDAMGAIMNRTNSALRQTLQAVKLEQIDISYHMYPDDWSDEDNGSPANMALYQDHQKSKKARRVALHIKRTLDVVFTAALLIILAPVMLAIAIAVKLSSKGPILYKQTRVGQYGKSFTFLKFRSMFYNNDVSAHREYVTKLIANRLDVAHAEHKGERIYKIKDDVRVTRVGRFLRRSSLDELPQLFNVLAGEMSLVGPRPALPYEVAAYEIWHRRRLLEAKPGITGLWQVKGRNRVKFDEMVRMDLAYATAWTPWLDVKILLQTPLAVIYGAGAW